MTPEEAKQYIKGKIVEELIFDSPLLGSLFPSDNEILSIRFTDGTSFNFGGGWGGEVYGDITFPDGKNEEIKSGFFENPPPSDPTPSIPPPIPNP